MKSIGILCATQRELEPFLAALEGDKTSRHALLTIHEGRLAGMEVAAAYSGVCKVNAAIGAQALIGACRVEALVMSGTAGGMDARLNIGDSVIATEVCYHDVAPGILTEYHPRMPQACFIPDAALLARCRQTVTPAPGNRIYYGRMATGEAFIDQDGRAAILAAHQPLCVDMETAAAAHVCYALGVPFFAVRSISDTATASGEGVFAQNCDFASAQSFRLVAQLLAGLAAE